MNRLNSISIAAFVVAYMLLSANPASTAEFDKDWLNTTAQRLKNSIVRIDVEFKESNVVPQYATDGDSRKTGSGFFIDQWHVVTAAHNVRRGTSPSYYPKNESAITKLTIFLNGRPAPPTNDPTEIEAIIVAQDNKLDIAVLRIPARWFQDPKPLGMDLCGGVAPRQPLAVASFDVKHSEAFSIVPDYHSQPDDDGLYTLKEEYLHGSSGGAVLDARRRVVGLLKASSNRDASFVPIHELARISNPNFSPGPFPNCDEVAAAKPDNIIIGECVPKSQNPCRMCTGRDERIVTYKSVSKKEMKSRKRQYDYQIVCDGMMPNTAFWVETKLEVCGPAQVVSGVPQSPASPSLQRPVAPRTGSVHFGEPQPTAVQQFDDFNTDTETCTEHSIIFPVVKWRPPLISVTDATGRASYGLMLGECIDVNSNFPSKCEIRRVDYTVRQ